MKRFGQIHKRYFALICLVLVLAYTVMILIPHTHEMVDIGCEDCTAIALIPHAHERGGIDCQECAILQSWRNALGALTLSAMLCGLVSVVWRVVPTHTYIGEARTGTPVGRKVKLSD